MPRKPLIPVRWFFAACLIAICLLAYEPGRMENSSGDTISARYWPIAILKHHTWSLTPFSKDLEGVGYAAIFSPDGTWIPRNGWGMAIFTVPFYAVTDVLSLGQREWTHERINQTSRANAVSLAMMSVILLFLLSRKFVSDSVAFASSLLFALGTWNWSSAAQGLFSQTAAVFSHLISLHMVWGLASQPEKKTATGHAAILGLIHALIWSLRPQDCLLIIPTIFVLRNRGSKAIASYLTTASSLVAFSMIIYSQVYDHPLGAYGVVENMGNQTFRLNPLPGLLGLLFSPNKGAIVFFPLLLLVPWLWTKYLPSRNWRAFFWKSARVRRERASQKLSSLAQVPDEFTQVTQLGASLYFTTLCFVNYWHGTWAFGSRYLYDLLPYLWTPITLAIAEVFQWLSGKKTRVPRWGLGLIIFLSLFSVAIHGLGHRNYDIYVWSHKVVPVNDEKAWSTKELFLDHLWRAGSNEKRYSPDILKRIREYGF